MDKKEYFNSLLKRDFIRYVLLKEPKYTDAEVSLKLHSKIDSTSLYQELKKHAGPVLDKYFKSDELKENDGKYVDQLPEWVDNNLPGRITAEFQAKIEKDYPAINYFSNLIAHIERLTWVQGVDDMIHNLRKFIQDLNGMSEHFRSISPARGEHYDLLEKYDSARRITVREHIMQDNDKDVEEYVEALSKYSRDLCGDVISCALSKLYSDLASMDKLNELIAKYEHINAQAENELRQLESMERNPEWDAEYQKRYPMDFFSRNIEDITAADAFRMVILQDIARREDELKEKGFITPEGELRLFTNPDYNYSTFGF